MQHTVKIGEQRMWRRNVVTIITEADDAHKVVVKKPDNTYGLAHIHDLELVPKARFHAWWTRGGSSLVLRRTENDGSYALMSIPQEIMPMLRRVMFSKKAAIKDSMRPQNMDDETNTASDTTG